MSWQWWRRRKCLQGDDQEWFTIFRTFDALSKLMYYFYQTWSFNLFTSSAAIQCSWWYIHLPFKVKLHASKWCRWRLYLHRDDVDLPGWTNIGWEQSPVLLYDVGKIIGNLLQVHRFDTKMFPRWAMETISSKTTENQWYALIEQSLSDGTITIAVNSNFLELLIPKSDTSPHTYEQMEYEHLKLHS